MAFENVSFSTEEVLTSTKMNKLPSNDNFLFDRLIPYLGANCVAKTGYGLYIVSFNGANLINPDNASGNGADGATWTKIWLGGGSPNSMCIQVAIPNTVFSSAPLVVGHTTGSESQWGIQPCSIYGESATGYFVTFKDSGGPSYPINTSFAYTALLLGPRKSNPT
ncbi:MAG: hypothetical protein AB1384_12385 [Actinomycetota bacterium]